MSATGNDFVEGRSVTIGVFQRTNARDHRAATNDRPFDSAPIRGFGASRCSHLCDTPMYYFSVASTTKPMTV